MGRHWRERMKEKKDELKFLKVDVLSTIAVIVVMICLLTMTGYLSYKIGYAKGDTDCNEAKAGIEKMYFKGWALASEASKVLAINKDTIKNCKEIGKHIVKAGQKIK